MRYVADDLEYLWMQIAALRGIPSIASGRFGSLSRSAPGGSRYHPEG